MKKIILSKGRSDSITTHKLLKDFTMVVPEDEVELYRATVGDVPFVAIDPNIIGLGKIRNWIINHFKEDDVVMFDDDIIRVLNVSRERPLHIIDIEKIDSIIQNTYEMAVDADCKLFGFNQTCDVRKYKSNEPFGMTAWVGGVVGVIRNELKFTEVTKFKVDIDYTLQQLLKYRRVWVENRFGFQQRRDNNKGGNSKYRTSADVEREIAYLQDKWGHHLKFNKGKTKELASLKVNRKSSIIF